MATPGLTGGERLRAKLEEIARQIEGNHKLKVGFLAGSAYPDGSGVTAAQTAWWLEYGHGKAPPRPFFRTMISKKSDKWGDALARILQNNGFNVRDALATMGEGIGDQLRDAIFELDSPPLSPVTLMLRKMRMDNPHLEITAATVGEAARRVAAGEDYGGASTKVGVATGHMSNSIGYEVS